MIKILRSTSLFQKPNQQVSRFLPRSAPYGAPKSRTPAVATLRSVLEETQSLQGNIDIEMESWGDDSHVLAQYQEVGFQIPRQQDIYRWQGA